jgi:hypothetical protein
MNSYIITVKCVDRDIQLLVKALSKDEARQIAEPLIQSEITTRIKSRKIGLQFPAICCPLKGDRDIRNRAIRKAVDEKNCAYLAKI